MRRAWFPAAPLFLAGASTLVAAPSGNATLKAEVKSFEKADANHSDTLSLDEFLGLSKPLATAIERFPATGEGDDPDELTVFATAMFEWFDFDDSSSIEFDEWFDARTRTEFGLSGPPLTDHNEVLDRNHDGWVKAGEFLPLVRSFLPGKKALTLFRNIVKDFEAATGSAGGSGTMGGSLQIEPVIGPGNSPGSLDVSSNWEVSNTAVATDWLFTVPSEVLSPGLIFFGPDELSPGSTADAP